MTSRRPRHRSVLFAGLLVLTQLACAQNPPSVPPDQLFVQGKFEQARAAYADAARRNRDQAAPRLGLIHALLRLDRWPEATREAEEAAHRFPRNADAHGLYALSLLRAGRPDEARAQAERARALDKDSYWALVAQGRLLLWDHRRDQARRQFDRAARLRPRLPDAWLGILLTFAESTDGESAAQARAVKAYRDLAPKGHPHDWMAANLEDLLPSHGAYARHFEKAPPFTVAAPDRAGTITLPIEREGSLVFLPVRIDGKPFRLLFDTGGGSAITLYDTSAKRLNLPVLARSVVHGAQGAEPSTRLKAETLTLGALTMRSIPLQTMAALDLPGDGIFGANILDAYAVTLDLAGNTLTLSRGKTAPPSPPGVRRVSLPFHNYHGYPLLPARVDGKSTWAFLDTGADDHGLSLRLAREIAARLPRDAFEEGTLEGRFGIGKSEVKSEYVTFQKRLPVSVGAPEAQVSFDWLHPVGMSDIDRHLSPIIEFEIGLLLGAPLLDHYQRVTIDYPRRRLTLESASPFSRVP